MAMEKYDIDKAAFEARFAGWFRENRPKLGSQTKWVILMGVSENTVRNWEQGVHTPEGYYMVRILELLDATIEDVLSFEAKRRYLKAVS